MAIWVGKQKMSCRSCIKGHRSSTCNHIGGPLWAVRPAGRPNKACIHGPGDLCLCAHYFPLTWLKAAIPRNKKCSCQGSAGGKMKCSCGAGNSIASASTPDDETQPIFYQDLVARGLQVTTEPVDLEVPASAPASCCSVPAPAPPPVTASCCSAPPTSVLSVQIPVTAPVQSSCCSAPVEVEPISSAPPVTNGHIKSESISSAPFTPIQQFQPPPDFSAMKFSSPGSNPADHTCECGPACNCVLCIDHPYNNATMHHIATEFGQMMSNNAPFSPSSGTNGTRHDFFPPGWLANGGMMPPNFNDSSFMGHHPPSQTHSPPSQATDMDIILNPADFQMFNFAFPPLEDGTEYDPGMNMDLGEMADLDMNGFCGGVPEGCPCGDDCACIGCQVHKPTNVVGHQSWC